MHPIKRLIFLLLLISFNGLVLAGEKIFTGVFSGDGRACYGKLFIKTKTIEWRTPFNVCKPTHYKIYSENFDGVNPDIVYILDNKKSCPFGVVHISPDPDNKYYQYAEGFVTFEDYKNKSTNFLGCKLERMDK